MFNTDDERRRRAAELARNEQRDASDRGRQSNDEGRWFHYGIAELRGETRQNGWQHEQSLTLPSGRERIHDNSRVVNEHEFREYKGGNHVRGEFVLEQISKEREALETDPKASGAWIVVEGAPMWPPVKSWTLWSEISKAASTLWKLLGSKPTEPGRSAKISNVTAVSWNCSTPRSCGSCNGRKNSVSVLSRGSAPKTQHDKRRSAANATAKPAKLNNNSAMQPSG